ncbi:translation initiation factor IF-3, mitochondrial [Protopterus annectens]|uniref:translation initiation factor IF-3, mitochondrial n=1 Tax=Protopterus annectens TaxID=7888 RepID=UPI001CFC27B0|nr:translation initiation factor IF-3, mitochondrial [Protopterus annectens]
MTMFCLRNIIWAMRNEINYNRWCHVSRNFSTIFTSTKVKTACHPWSLTFCKNQGPCTLLRKTSSMTYDETEGKTNIKHKKEDPRARKTIGSIGRKIHHRIIHVLNENGEDLGNIHRAEVIRIMDERGLKLVPMKENADPPVYRLMTGKQIHEEQMKLREKQKANTKSGPTQIKELTLSADIAKHDLETKMKQIQQWIDKNHHVRITLRKRATGNEADKMEEVMNQIVEHLTGKATFVTKPKNIREGMALMCILRHMSQKEISEYKRQQKLAEDQQETKDISTDVSEVKETVDIK